MQKSIKKRYTKKKGGCGCSSSSSSTTKQTPSLFFLGGKTKKRRRLQRRKIKGGVALGCPSLTNYDPSHNYTYPLKDEGLNPSSPNEITDSRILPNTIFGGKNKKQQLKNKKRGGSVDPVIQNYSANSISNFASNSIVGAVNGANIVSGKLIPTNNHQSFELQKPFI